MLRLQFFLIAALLTTLAGSVAAQTDRKNVVFILSDDHRYDFMGFMNKVPFLKTPNMDRMAANGTHIKNAFVSTSLCSPSRASILSGQYAHKHEVVDNQSAIPEDVVFFPEYLQEAGYQTAFVGKWHMGEHHADPRPGFDYWGSFRGQGVYYNPTININGEEVNYSDSAYVTDVLTDLAIDFLNNRDEEDPFFLFLSHKGVHADFKPAPRHLGVYEDEKVVYPPTMFPPEHKRSTVTAQEYNYEDVPNWVKAQRYSWHGVDYMYHGQIEFEEFYKRYLETLLSVDESIGTVLDYLEEKGLMENTLIIYMGDNGFSFGEHGLIDKRQAYEESMRVPMLAMGAGIPKGTVLEEVIQNIDVAPTVMDFAGMKKKENMHGNSFKALLYQEEIPWIDTMYYEYFWERPFPQTPTMHAVRTSKYKFIRYYGVWDINELYDIENDPNEMNNLIRNPEYAQVADELRNAIFNWLERTEGESIPLKIDHGKRFDHGYRDTY